MIDLMAISIFMVFGLIGILGLLLTVYVIYDVLIEQTEMQPVEKLIWIAAIVAFNIFGIIAYLIMVKSQEDYLMDRISLGNEEKKLDEIERLQQLKEEGALTDDEFEEEKQKLLEDGD
ncbi:MAG: SHOCT domain-containing protein [Candidatus Nanohaloarchaeota archaeon QJJ-7]|nr:SHOCT domain-containing protein [Candidatus Nanohaloarchaeota archaeon QJJ-7]